MKPPTFSYRITRRRGKGLPKASPLRFYYWSIVDDRTGAVVARDTRPMSGTLDIEEAERDAKQAAQRLGIASIRRSYPLPFSAVTVYGEG